MKIIQNLKLEKFSGKWVNLCRFILAAVFIYSGFVKAVDPMGTQYKIEDYLTAFGITWMPALIPLCLSLFQAALELLLGVFLLLGIRRRLSSLLTLILYLFFTPLTLYLAIANPVSDCGCFGDALVLTNWQTFTKNIILLLMAVSLQRKPLLMPRFISKHNQWIITLFTVIFIMFFSSYNLYHLPLFDFRPYHIGADIPKGMTIPEGAKQPKFETTFILQKNGVKKEFTLDNYPDSTWTFVDSKSVQTEAGYVPPIHDLSLTDVATGEDLTDSVLTYKGYVFLLVAPWLERADQSHIDLINELNDYCVIHGYPFYCFTSSTDKSIAGWKDATAAEYRFVNVDGTTLKTIIRSNPGLVLLKNGVVINKWGDNDFPDEYQLKGPLEQLPIAHLTPVPAWKKLSAVVLWYVVPLLLVVIADRWWENRKKRKQAKAEEPKENDLE